MASEFLIFSALLPIVGGALCLLIGLVLSDYLEQLFLLITHSETPSYIKDKPGISSTLTFLKAIGTLFKILGVGLFVKGIIEIGMAIF